jgi:F420-non-reducing hydrogenase iron-sulfur subunit
MLGAMGYADSTLTIVERAKQVDYSTTDCVGCDKCVHVCPYKAISTGQFGTPSIDYLKCTGCGACTVVCPHLALEISGYECKHIAEIIENNSRQIKKGNAYPPAILVFCCQWAEFGNLDPRIESMVRPNLSIIEIPCFSKLDPINVIQALNQGYDGVLAVTCSDNDCKSKESRNTAEDNMTVLSAGLKIMGLESRFKVYKTSPRKVGDFNREVESFSNIISSLKREGVTGHE